jgi:hypothetical protein
VSAVETDLLLGIAQYLNDVGAATYRPTGGYLATDTAIVFGELPTSPDRVVAITVYGSDDEGQVPLSQMRVQFMFRGKPNNTLDAGEVAGPVFEHMQGLEHLQCGAAHINLAQRVSRITLGADENKRQLRSDNYALDVDMPATAGRPG